jgi:hypothetical protein
MNSVLALLLFSALVTLGCSKPTAKGPPSSASSADNLFVWNRPPSPLLKLPITQSATCRFKKVLDVSFRKKFSGWDRMLARLGQGKLIPDDPNEPERVYYSAHDEDEADTVAFLDLDTNAPKVQSNNGQAALQVLYRDPQMLTLIHTEAGDTEVYTIFLDKGVVTLSQHENSVIMGGPFGVLEMGYCN